MYYENFTQLTKKVKEASPKTVVLAAAHDKHSLEAVFSASKVLPIKYKLVGNRAKIQELAQQIGWDIDLSCIVDAADDTDCAAKSVALIKAGKADVLMKGILETGTLLKAVLDKENGIRGSGVMSHVAVLEVPAYHKLFIVTDGGMNTHPDLKQKAAIVKNAVDFLCSLGYECPKVAALCASESVSDKMPETKDAAELAKMAVNKELGNCILEGPLSFDLAISKESAAIKGVSSKITGEADILFVPDIATGNIFSKSLLYWGQAKMAGCVLGAKAPIVLVSRGASSEEKLLSIMLCLSPKSN